MKVMGTSGTIIGNSMWNRGMFGFPCANPSGYSNNWQSLHIFRVYVCIDDIPTIECNVKGMLLWKVIFVH